ncbi:hypothetical protein [Spiribacter roseus]|uniref:Glycosyltransferase RgtA/B/C/D-like domain-containing protein n=1 Tax=Spiribacter roseus TaxID=1855875 RepID=A0ABV3S1V1_9GAMM
MVALVVRVAAILVGYFVAPLPDSGADARSFESRAWEWSQGGFFEALGHFTGPNSYFISWILSVLYSVADRSLLMAQSVSLLFGMGTVWMGWLLTRALWGERVAGKAGWVLALFPTLILYSALTMREAYIQFFLLTALYGVVGWARSGGMKPVVVAIAGFIGATFFHGAMIVGAIVFVFIVGLSSTRRLLRALLRNRVHLFSAAMAISAAVGISLFVSGAISVPKIGTFERAIDADRLIAMTESSTRGGSGGEEGASYPQWTVPNSAAELLYKGPIRVVYFTFSPFPWDVRSARHLIGLFDAFLYMGLIFLIWRNRKAVWADRASRSVVLVLAAYLLVFGLAIGNFGTGIRHRAKFVAVLIALAAPKLKGFRLRGGDRYRPPLPQEELMTADRQ